MSSGDSGSTDGCRGESCLSTLLVETEKLDDALLSVKQRLQNISAGTDSTSRLYDLVAHVSDTEVGLAQVTKVDVAQVPNRMLTQVTKVDLTSF